ncbi:MAG: AbrB/MazE/SpoVT family DNA-binding domain-containing protein [Oleiphilaceae bacterium]|nr:AbrB/MazE/SpoVT family DNA-binding domain-containing protein [Oleiphilaceae bacterium]
MVTEGESVVDKNGQLVIPHGVRKALGIQPGDKLTWTLDESGEIRVRLAGGGLFDLQGSIKSGGRLVSIEEMRLSSYRWNE